MKLRSTLVFLSSLALISCQPDPADLRDTIIGTYNGTIAPYYEDLKPVPVMDLTVSPAYLTKSQEKHAFTLTIEGRPLKCTDLKSTTTGFTFSIPEQQFIAWAVEGQFSGANKIEVEGAMHQGVIDVARGRIRLYVRQGDMRGPPIFGFEGTREP